MKKKLMNLYLGIAVIWVVMALLFQVTFVILSLSGSDLPSKIAKELTWRLDGRFSN